MLRDEIAVHLYMEAKITMRRHYGEDLMPTWSKLGPFQQNMYLRMADKSIALITERIYTT